MGKRYFKDSWFLYFKNIIVPVKNSKMKIQTYFRQDRHKGWGGGATGDGQRTGDPSPRPKETIYRIKK